MKLTDEEKKKFTKKYLNWHTVGSNLTVVNDKRIFEGIETLLTKKLEEQKTDITFLLEHALIAEERLIDELLKLKSKHKAK